METNKNQCVCQTSEEYFEASENVKSIHTSTKRIYWAILFISILFTMNCIGLYNQHFSASAVGSRESVQRLVKVGDSTRKYINEHYKELFYNMTNADSIQMYNIVYDSIYKKTQDTSLANSMAIDSITKYKEKLSHNMTFIDSVEMYHKIHKAIYDTIYKHTYKEENDLRKEDWLNYIMTTDAETKACAEKNIELNYVHPPFIGSSFSVEDMFPIMIGVYLLAFLWLYYCIRAENLCVGKILNKLYVAKNQKVKRYVFYSIVYNNIIFPSTRRREPYDHVDIPGKKIKDKIDKLAEKNKPHRDRFNKLFFVAFPAIIIIVNLLIYIGDNILLWGANEWFMRIIKLKFENFLLLCCIAGIVIIICILCKMAKTIRATNNLLRDFKRKFKHNEDSINAIKDNNLTEEPKRIVVVTTLQKDFSNSDFEKKFAEKYSEDNGYYLCCNTSEKKEEKSKAQKFLEWLRKLYTSSVKEEKNKKPKKKKEEEKERVPKLLLENKDGIFDLCEKEYKKPDAIIEEHFPDATIEEDTSKDNLKEYWIFLQKIKE